MNTLKGVTTQRITVAFISLLLFTLMFSFTSQAIVWESTIHVGDANFTNCTLNFDNINWDDTSITFNDTTTFVVTSSNVVNITLTYLSEDVMALALHDIAMSFNATATTGTLTNFLIGGFVPNYIYTVYRNGTAIAQPQASPTGIIIFTNDQWSKRVFTINYEQLGSIPALTQTTNYLVQTIIPIVVSISLIVMLVALFFTGTIDIKSLLMWLVMTIIAIAVIMSIV